MLAVVYAARRLPVGPRSTVMAAIRKAMRWSGEIDGSLIAHLSGVSRTQPWSFAAHRDPVGWARSVLGLEGGRRPARGEVQRRFRALAPAARRGHAGERATAAARPAAPRAARRILP